MPKECSPQLIQLRDALVDGSPERVAAQLDRLLLVKRLKRGGNRPMNREKRSELIQSVLRWWEAPRGRHVEAAVRPEYEDHARWLAEQLEKLLTKEADPHDETYREWQPGSAQGSVYDVGKAI